MKKIFYLMGCIMALGIFNLAYSSGENIYPAEESMVTNINASSFLPDNKKRYVFYNIIDNKADSWCEGKKDDGVGEWVKAGFERRVKLSEFYVMNGYGEKDYWIKNNRVKGLQVISDENKTVFVVLPDSNEKQLIKLPEPLEGKVFTFKIQSVYPGTVYRDTCLAELSFHDFDLEGGSKKEFCGKQFKSFEIKYDTIKLKLKDNGDIEAEVSGNHRECEERLMSGSWYEMTNMNDFNIQYTLGSGGDGMCGEIDYGLKLESCPGDKKLVFKYSRKDPNNMVFEKKTLKCSFVNTKGNIVVKDCVDVAE